MLDCQLCGEQNIKHVNYRTLVVPIITQTGTIEKGATARLCSTCVSAHGFMLGREYWWRRYGDERPDNARHDLKTRGGCPHCEYACSECPYAEE